MANTPEASESTSSTATFLMPNSLTIKNRSQSDYRPKVTRTLGQRPACLVNASVTFCGKVDGESNDVIYAFGGFDAFTDEVYNHVLKLDMGTSQWSLVDNYGDIPGVRMGHTATLYQGDKLLIFGGENEHREYLSDLIIFDLKTAHWTQPVVTGPKPKGRARHAAVLHDDKLFIIGGITGANNDVLDDICYLDLKTCTWSRQWRFERRFDHQASIWGDRMWVFGGLDEDSEKVGDIYWLDLKGNPAFDSPPAFSSPNRPMSTRPGSVSRSTFSYVNPPAVGSTGYAANSGSAQVNPPSFLLTSAPQPAPGAISSLKFVSGPNIPAQGSGTHFHLFTSGTLLDFVTPAATITPQECCLSALDLETLRWQKLAQGRELFRSGYKWHYCTMNTDGTKAWLLGCPQEPSPNSVEEYLSDIMEIDLRKYGLLGNNLTTQQPRPETIGSRAYLQDRHAPQPSKGLGADLAKMFNIVPEQGSGADFMITALCEADDAWDDDGNFVQAPTGAKDPNWLPANAPTSPPIHVHKLILMARWPHFRRLYESQMAEFQTRKMHIPEPFSVVRAFLYYLYTDSVHQEDCPELSDVAGLLVMSNIYNIPNLRLLCVNRLAKELDVEHACVVWHCAGIASEEWLRRRAAAFCLMHWGRVVRTQGFLRLPRHALVELSQEIDMEGRVVGGEELEVVGGLGGGRFGGGLSNRRVSSSSAITSGGMNGSEIEDDDEDEGMDLA